MSKKDIIFTVQTGRGQKSYTFPQETKVAEVVEAVKNDFGYPADASLVLVKEGIGELEPQRPLVSYKIEDGEILQLSDKGGGV